MTGKFSRKTNVCHQICQLCRFKVDVEMGYFLQSGVTIDEPMRLPSGDKISAHMLPAIEIAVTAVRVGPLENGYEPYAALGSWVEENDYRLAGPVREVFIELPTSGAGDAVVEIQIPVKTARVDGQLLPSV